MSDTTTAPPSQPNPSPAPSSTHEVPINQNPTNSPNPVGPQAPDAPAKDPAVARKEAIQRAFDRANKTPGADAKPAQRPAPPAAEAKKGHNQAPEETPDERLDLKKRPADQPRGDRGRFTSTQDERRGEVRRGQFDAQAGVRSPDQPGQPVRTLPETAPYRDPPPRMAEHAKRDWADTPETVRGEIGRMHEEFGKAYQYYRADHEAFKPLRPYNDLARSQGTTLDRALSNYVSMEQKLRADPLGGLDLIVHNLGLTDPETGRRLDLRDVAYTVLSRSPEQLKMMQQGNQQQAASHQIGALHQEISGLKAHLQQMHTQQQFSYTRSAVDQFADSHPRFDELGDLIERELRLGFDLNTAYQRASLLRPATRADQTRNPSAQTRTTDRSISGAPGVAGSNPASRRQEHSKSPRDAIQNALKRVNGAL